MGGEVVGLACDGRSERTERYAIFRFPQLDVHARWADLGAASQYGESASGVSFVRLDSSLYSIG